MIRVLSLFSGIGGFDLAFERAGMEIVANVESDPHCRKVLRRHWPEVRQYEDVRSVGLGRSADHQRGQQDNTPTRSAADQWDGAGVDLICGGFPCQPFSVAGRRAGEADERNLWPEFRRVVSELRPRWVVAENVPGLLSVHGGRFFGSILDDLGELGFAGVAYAVLDSQHFGVPQRRRRVFIVAGPARRAAEQVLALCESCGGHPTAGRATWEDVANLLGASATSFGGQRYDLDNETYIPELSYALAARNAKGVSLLESQDTFVVRTAQTSANGHGVSDKAHTLDGANSKAVAHTLRADGFDASEDGTGRGTPPVACETADTLSIGANQTYGHAGDIAAQGASVRRLTPTECARLQAFPDDWLEGLGLSDGHKYRMLGNAVTVSVVQWIGERIASMEEAACATCPAPL